MSGLGICSFTHHSFAHLLRSLKSNEWLWAIRWDSSGQMSHCEQIIQVAHDIWAWATVSDSLRLLMINEQIVHFFWGNCLFFPSKSLVFSERIPQLLFPSQKQAIRSKKNKKKQFLCTFKKRELFAHFLFCNERCEQIAQVAHQIG